VEKNIVEPDMPQRKHGSCALQDYKHSKYVNVLLFHCNNGSTNAPQCYFIRKLPVFLLFKFLYTKLHSLMRPVYGCVKMTGGTLEISKSNKFIKI